MTAKELIELLSRANPDDQVVFALGQANKVYPVAYLETRPQYPVAFHPERKRVVITGSLEEGEYVKTNKNQYGQRIGDAL